LFVLVEDAWGSLDGDENRFRRFAGFDPCPLSSPMPNILDRMYAPWLGRYDVLTGSHPYPHLPRFDLIKIYLSTWRGSDLSLLRVTLPRNLSFRRPENRYPN